MAGTRHIEVQRRSLSDRRAPCVRCHVHVVDGGERVRVHRAGIELRGVAQRPGVGADGGTERGEDDGESEPHYFPASSGLISFSNLTSTFPRSSLPAIAEVTERSTSETMCCASAALSTLSNMFEETAFGS